jgi:hypothetical protein
MNIVQKKMQFLRSAEWHLFCRWLDQCFLPSLQFLLRFLLVHRLPENTVEPHVGLEIIFGLWPADHGRPDYLNPSKLRHETIITELVVRNRLHGILPVKIHYKRNSCRAPFVNTTHWSWLSPTLQIGLDFQTSLSAFAIDSMAPVIQIVLLPGMGVQTGYAFVIRTMKPYLRWPHLCRNAREAYTLCHRIPAM